MTHPVKEDTCDKTHRKYLTPRVETIKDDVVQKKQKSNRRKLAIEVKVMFHLLSSNLDIKTIGRVRQTTCKNGEYRATMQKFVTQNN